VRSGLGRDENQGGYLGFGFQVLYDGSTTANMY